METTGPAARDGYGIPFDPARHREFVRAGDAAAREGAYADPCGTGRIDPDAPPKNRPAGWWDKTGRSGV